MPVSVTVATIVSPSVPMRTVTRPPGSVYLIALEARLVSRRCSSSGSPGKRIVLSQLMPSFSRRRIELSLSGATMAATRLSPRAFCAYSIVAAADSSA